jgi:hypothetical protein
MDVMAAERVRAIIERRCRARLAVFALAGLALAVSPAAADSWRTTPWPPSALSLAGGPGVLTAPGVRFLGSAADPWLGLAGGTDRELRPFLTVPFGPGRDLTVRRAAADTPAPDGSARPGLAGTLRLRLVEERGRRPAVAAGFDLDGSAEAAGGWIVAGRRVGPLDIGLGAAFGPYEDGDLIAGRSATWSPVAIVAAPLFDGRLTLQAALPPGADGGWRWADGRLPIDLGLDLRALPWLSLGLVRHGDGGWSGRIALRPPEGTVGRPPAGSPPPIVVRPPAAPDDPTRPDIDPVRVERTVAAALAEAGLAVEAVRIEGTLARLWLEPAPEEPAARTLGRAARALTGLVPDAVRRLRLTLGRHGLDTVRVDLWRHELEAAARHAGSTAELWHGGDVLAPDPAAVAPPDRRPTPALAVDLRSRLTVALDDVETGLAVRHTASAGLVWRPRPRLVLGGRLAATLRHDVPTSGTPAPSSLQPVRSDGAATRDTALRLDRLWLARLWRPHRAVVLRGVAGWLDPDLAGAAAAVLWQPLTARWAVEAEVAAGLRRDPAAALALHADPRASALVDLHWQPPGAPLALRLGGGRYLAGDWGVDAGLTRRFDSGVAVGVDLGLSLGPPPAFAGPEVEPAGRIGLRLTIPLQPSLPAPLRRRVALSQEVALAPVRRDAGARPMLPLDLSDLTRPVGYGAVARTWPRLLD